ncbi:MAG: hypothetical protein DCF25_05475 [Leptolyngbya foveolarum]|uniref:Type I restriction enzyme R protein N-terminal domain-containing protein n=1 Tax=Leptolyngbya foveolarum TaxID=47253 RepID=A0A2W4WFT2_9CYAN|nr:MAG: hypothetical protein DCF25_05475 [Leptolyngbya foveolarum]
MSRLNLLEKGKSYTFRSYFEMPYETDDILSEFGVSFSSTKLSLPKADVPVEVAAPLQLELEKRMEITVSLSSEIARRETLASPILFKIAELSGSQLRIEYPLTVSNQLKGKLDYLVRGPKSLLVIEAKNGDLARGFTQLAIEMIAISQLEKMKETLYGAVTTGDAWVFGRFDIEAQHIVKDTTIYAVPSSLPVVMSILLGALAA